MAITSVSFQPKLWTSGYNPIIWTVNSNINTLPDMRYVFDVYVNAATGATAATYRVKQRPNPSGYGQIDVSSLVQPFINLTNVNYEKTTTQYKSTSDINPYVHVKVGEEYTVSGVTTSLNGSGVTGAPGYFLSPYGATGYSVRVIPASLDFNTQIGIMQDTTVFNPFWSNYIMDGNDSKFLSLEPGDRSIRLTDRYTLTFLNIWDFAGSPGTYAQSILGMEYKLYNAAGTMTYSNFINNTVANGGGPQTTATYTSITSVRGTNFLTFRCGPADLADIALANPAYYTVTAYVKITATSSPDPVYMASQTIRFNIDTQCEDLYPNVRLSWLNSLGGRDYYNFDMFYEKTTKSKAEVYNQVPLNWSSSAPVNNASSTTPFENYMRGGDKVYNKTVDTEFTIQTDYLTQEYVDYLADIAESPSVWAYIGEEDIPTTVVVSNVDYTYKNVKQTKLVQATFTCKVTKNQVKQSL